MQKSYLCSNKVLGVHHRQPSKTRSYLKLLISLHCALLVVSLFISSAHAATDMKLEYKEQNGQVHMRCNFGDTTDVFCEEGVRAGENQTPFLYETITGDDGNSYIHMIIGDPDEAFAQEVYIRGSYSSDGAGTANGATIPLINGSIDLVNFNPLSSLGQGTANPTKVIMRQDIKGTDISMVFIKDNLLTKPKMTQIVTSEDMVSEFIVDMSAIAYDDKSTPTEIINNLTFSSSEIPGDGGSFNMIENGDNVTVDAGLYTYVEGTGTFGSEGTYDYDGSEFNMDQPWEDYAIPEMNPSNPFPN